MGKQAIKNKSSKKELSFTGKRILGENKSKFIINSNDSENTTDQMMEILGSEISFKQTHTSNNVSNNASNNVQDGNQNRIKSLLGSIDNQQSMFQNIGHSGNQVPLGEPMPGQPIPGQPMFQPMPGQPMPSQPMFQPMPQPMPGQPGMYDSFNGNYGQNMNMQMNNQFTGVPPDINDDMVNTFAPVHNMNTNNLLSAHQMAQNMGQNMGNIANLSKLSEMQSYGSSNQSLFEDVSSLGNNVQPRNFDVNKFKNIANLNQMTML
jgi:hypothetical protein